MVATEIRTYDELVALQKDPGQYTDWLSHVVAEKMGVTPESIAASLQRAIAKQGLPGRPPMTDAAARPWSDVKGYELARKAGFAPNDYVANEYGSRTGEFETFGRFAAAIAGTKNGYQNAKLKAALSEAAGQLGGFLVPEEYRMELRMLQLEQAQFRGHATVLPMASMVEHWPYVRDTSHVSSVYGGVIGYWEAEAATIGESEPAFGQLTLTAHKLTAYTVASNEVISDSGGAIESFISQQFPKALNFFEEHGFWRGNGGGQPKGVLNASALISTTRTVASHVSWEDLVNMSTHFLPSSNDNYVWFANPSVKADLYTMALNVGTGGSAIMVNPMTGGGAGVMPQTIMGLPLIFTEHLPALGTKGDLVAVDLSYYLIGDRQTMSMMASPHVQFTQDRTVFRLIERLDGQPWIDSALTLNDGSTTVSPFICIAT